MPSIDNNEKGSIKIWLYREDYLPLDSSSWLRSIRLDLLVDLALLSVD